MQILHPDKFAGNEKLQNRATEQFKRLQEAYDLLSSGAGGGRGGRGARSGSSSGASSSSGAARAWTEVEDGVEVEYLTEAEIKARLAGHRPPPAPSWWPSSDTVSDERRNGLAMAAIGAVATLLTIRRPFGILGMIAAVAGTATVWGIIQFLGAQRNLNTLNEHLAKLTEERKEYEALLEE